MNLTFTERGHNFFLLIQVLNLEAMDNSRHWRIVGCSAYTGDGLLEGFDWLVQDVASRIYMLD
uniref:ADP-ribosylation factor n=1 Tax=Solanum tuberosum TaxID=4113 RepID=M1BUU4_SOLTU